MHIWIRASQNVYRLFLIHSIIQYLNTHISTNKETVFNDVLTSTVSNDGIKIINLKYLVLTKTVTLLMSSQCFYTITSTVFQKGKKLSSPLGCFSLVLQLYIIIYAYILLIYLYILLSVLN